METEEALPPLQCYSSLDIALHSLVELLCSPEVRHPLSKKTWSFYEDAGNRLSLAYQIQLLGMEL